MDEKQKETAAELGATIAATERALGDANRSAAALTAVAAARSRYSDRAAAAVVITGVLLVVAVIVGGFIIVGRNSDAARREHEAGARAAIERQGGSVEAVDCFGDRCTAIIGGSAYTVAIVEDENGNDTYGVSPLADN